MTHKPDTDTSATAKSTFFCKSDFDGSEIKAASWNEAMDKAFMHMVDSDYGDDGQGTERISYTVYLIPDGWSTDGITQGTLNACKSRNGTYVRGREA